MKKVIIVMGAEGDLPVMEAAANTLTSFGVPFEVRILSAHRTPQAASELSKTARESGVGVIIAAAGKAAHLAGAMAAQTTIPIIGVPIKASFDGLDSLLSTVQMPTGIPVATVAVNSSENAALLAVQMLSIEDKQLADALDAHRAAMQKKILAKDEEIRNKFSGKVSL